jgi:hypothetical protein
MSQTVLDQSAIALVNMTLSLILSLSLVPLSLLEAAYIYAQGQRIATSLLKQEQKTQTHRAS